ncbi:MAG: Dihydrofolate synthase/folylpolyglutamate synthase [candidate division WS2 bacterium]|nr:Dihydrofolate synthase/folylpolyglutamate synthase [Candidatus Psychracetigena formicireducens]
MGYAGAIDYLYGLQKHGIKLGLDNTVKLLSLFNNPQEKFHSIHVAGTNGKGSTSAMIASILQAAEFRTGLFTSPHLVSFTERIRVNNGEIKAGRRIEVNGYKITAYRVNHSVPATGYIIEDRKGKRLLYTGDTGTTYAIWKEAGKARIHPAP